MNAVLGTAGVSLGLCAAVAGVISLAVGLVGRRPALVRSARWYVALVLGGALLATGAMESALISRDFSLTYVAENGSTRIPLLYTIASLWGALEGSIILWSLVLAGYVAAVAWRYRRRLDDPVVGWALLAGLAVCVFFFGLMMGPANPFTRVSGPVPTEGPGPNPLLQNHPLMAIHPPMLYLGYVGFTVPFAFAIGSLVTGRVDEGWLAETRRWTLAAWGFLTVGIVLGAWWSYEVLGWGGYWAWDPVENASFLPWLTGTAFLHSAMVEQQRGMLRVWNLSLLVATFSLTILGTFITRSGVLDSVHAFTESSVGPLLLGFFAVVVAVGVGLIGWRGDRLRTAGRIDSAVSRESSFLLNNLLFAGFALVVLLGTVFPLLVEALNGDRLSVGRPFFDRMAIPLGMALLFLMAVAPLLPWRRASAELLHQRLLAPAWLGAAAVAVPVLAGVRGLTPLIAFGLAGFAAGAALRHLAAGVRRSGLGALTGRQGGGMIVHLGVVLVAVALAASGSYAHSREVRLTPGESATVGGHRVTYLGSVERETPQKTTFAARVQVDGGDVHEPAINRFPFATQAIGTPSVATSLSDDVYLTLLAPPGDDDEVVISVLVQPLVTWLWIGGLTMGVGTLLAVVPRRRLAAAAEPAADPVAGQPSPPTPADPGGEPVPAPAGVAGR